mgnify:FL=1
MNLISSKDFRRFLTNKSDSEYRRLRENFDNFLEKPLKLGYFIPCDENDVPLEESKRWKDYLDFPESFDGNKEWYELYAYQEAKQRVLFEYQWEFQSWDSSDMENSIIEDLLSDELIYTLTATAKKEIGLWNYLK